ncbi:meiotic recombination protein REC114 isoform X1 [Amia ocellicauda]|uniref:meiotic recombination protein REC114 isoform X1 n=1 Tax=Amia ocellicauda TaxID=2972642 RepID=UPI0034647512
MADVTGGDTVDGRPPAEDLTSTKFRWTLKRYGRFVPMVKESAKNSSWKVFDSSGSEEQLLLTIVQSGHFLISQGPQLLEGFSLLNAPTFLKVVRKSDILLFSLKLKSESRMFRVQFEGGCREEALEHCWSAALRLQHYLPVRTQDCTQAQGAASVSDTQHENELCEGEAAGVITEGTLPVTQLAQSFLGECKLSLPLVYKHSTLPTKTLGPFLHLCLLDQNFPAFVEEVESELKKLANE